MTRQPGGDWMSGVTFRWSGRFPAGTDTVSFRARSRGNKETALTSGSITVSPNAAPSPTPNAGPHRTPTRSRRADAGSDSRAVGSPDGYTRHRERPTPTAASRLPRLTATPPLHRHPLRGDPVAQRHSWRAVGSTRARLRPPRKAPL